jgi:hypothetical protein
LTGAVQVKTDAIVNATIKPRSRRGARGLRGRIDSGLLPYGQGLGIWLGADAPHAAAQEFGARIMPKKKYLAIPFGDALTRGGSLKGEFNRPGGLRTVNKLRFQRSKDGRPFLVWDDGEQTRWGFRLHPGPVHIPKTRYLGRAMDKLLARLPDRLSHKLGIALEGRDGG